MVKTYTVDAADTWEYKTITFPADTTGAFDNDHNNSLAAEFWLVAGSDYTSGGTQTTWASMANNKRAGGHTANAGASDNDYVRITGVQLEVGNQATEYEHKTHHEELSACQRYYYKIVGDDSDMAAFGFNYSGSAHYFNVEFPVPMRTYPTYTGSATDARIFAQNIGQDFNLSSLAIVGNMNHAYPTRVTLYVSQGGASAGEGGLLSIQNEEGYLQFSAEL